MYYEPRVITMMNKKQLFSSEHRFSSETLQYLNSGCTGPLCVQVEDYSQVSGSVQAYASGDVKIWIGTSYTSYGLYELIPKVGLPGPGSCQAPSPYPHQEPR